MQFGRVPWFFGALFGGIGYFILALGWWLILTQQHRLNTYVPVLAQIVSSRVETTHSSKGADTHRPMIVYEYEVAGKSYQNDDVRPVLNASSSGGWAWRIVQQYPPGTETSAWVSPADPHRAFLSREPDWLPYLLAVFGLPFAAVGTWALFLHYQGSRKLRPPVKGTDGWFELREERTIGGQFRLRAVCTLLWYGYLALCIGHYIAVLRNGWDDYCTTVAVIGGGFGIAGLVQTCCSWRLMHDFNEAIVCVSAGQFRVGDSIQVRLCQQMRRPIVVQGLSVGVICMRSDRVQAGTSVSYTPSVEATSVWKSLDVASAYPPDEQILATTELTLPPDAAGSTRPWQPTYPFYQWFLVLKLAAEGQPVLNLRYPIVVEPSEDVSNFASSAGTIQRSNLSELP